LVFSSANVHYEAALPVGFALSSQLPQVSVRLSVLHCQKWLDDPDSPSVLSANTRENPSWRGPEENRSLWMLKIMTTVKISLVAQ